jgi:hypothetical protein
MLIIAIDLQIKIEESFVKYDFAMLSLICLFIFYLMSLYKFHSGSLNCVILSPRALLAHQSQLNTIIEILKRSALWNSII